MALSKKAQYIIWDGRKTLADANGNISAENAQVILNRCDKCPDSREDLMKAITSRPYHAQPQRAKTYTGHTVSAAEQLLATVAKFLADGTISDEEAEPFRAKAAELKAAEERKAAEAKKAAALNQMNAILNAAQAI